MLRAVSRIGARNALADLAEREEQAASDGRDAGNVTSFVVHSVTTNTIRAEIGRIHESGIPSGQQTEESTDE